ncbi:hypothetical protein ACR2XN_28490, partial [Klebsiella pneumoniae]
IFACSTIVSFWEETWGLVVASGSILIIFVGGRATGFSSETSFSALWALSPSLSPSFLLPVL